MLPAVFHVSGLITCAQGEKKLVIQYKQMRFHINFVFRKTPKSSILKSSSLVGQPHCYRIGGGSSQWCARSVPVLSKLSMALLLVTVTSS